MEQELLNQVFGDLISTCESYISNIVLKEDGADQLQEDLLVSLVPLHGLVKGCACSQNEGSVKFLAVAVMAMESCLCGPGSIQQFDTFKIALRM